MLLDCLFTSIIFLFLIFPFLTSQIRSQKRKKEEQKSLSVQHRITFIFENKKFVREKQKNKKHKPN